MNFICQTEALENIKLLADHKQHGVLIVGDPGSGKTYLAKRYAELLGISDFYIINPVISDLKTMIDTCVSSGTEVVICIENLDSGVLQASYPLLKLIEDCPGFIYVVVTCNNLYSIPDTIPSRCALVTINPPNRNDLEQYAKAIDLAAYDFVSKHLVWSCVRGFSDVDMVLKFTPEHLKYYNNIPNILSAKDSVSTISWKLMHYDDNSEAPVAFVMRYILGILKTDFEKRSCIGCLNDLADNRISKNAIVSKFLFDLKYCG